MEIRLVKLKGDFNNVITIRNNVKNVFDILQVRIDKLRQIYSEFIESNKNEMFVFGLDSFHFQSKLIDIEYDDMKRLFLAINNRMYCEYFKLHKIIVEYISKSINDKRSIDLVKINNYPTYKDLEPFKEYKFEVVLDIHENILNLLGVIISILNNKENELSIHKTKQNIGLNIDNFITTFNFNLSVMREKIGMFIAYIEFFHKMHSKYIKRFSNKIQLMYTHINNDIKFDDSIEISKNKKKELIDEFVNNHVDKELLKDLKTSIGSETNSEISTGSKSSLNTLTNMNIETDEINFEDIHMSPLNMENVDNTVSMFSFSPRLREKRDFKTMVQKNVYKVSSMFNLCKPKIDDIIDTKISNSDLQKIFSGINQSCDSIINKTNDNDATDKQDNMPYLPIDIENYNEELDFIHDINKDSTIDELLKSVEDVTANITENTITEKITNENIQATESIQINIDEIDSRENIIINEIDNKIDEIKKLPDTNNELLEDLTEDDGDACKKEDTEVKEDNAELKEPIVDETIKQNEVPKKKKRTYNKRNK
jgi:hypothetical protein